MSEVRVTWEMLNAYVDGELSPAERAGVARAAAEDRRVAQQIAAIEQLKLALAGEREAPDLHLPSARPPRRMRLALAAAACAALVVLGAHLALRPDPATDSLAAALDLHRSWSEQADATALRPLPARLAAFGGPAAIDLSAAKLSLAHVTELDEPSPLVLLGYVGNRGCKVSLVIGVAIEGSGALVRRERGPFDAYAWRASGVGFVLVASGMDAARFRSIAEALAQATRERAPLDRETRLALAESRTNSPPCAA